LIRRKGTWTWTIKESSKDVHSEFCTRKLVRHVSGDRLLETLGEAKATEALDEFAQGFPARLHRSAFNPASGGG